MRCSFILLAAGTLAMPAHAAAITADAASAAAALVAAGYPATVETASDGTPYVRSVANKIDFGLFFSKCRTAACASISFYIHFKPYKKVPAKWVNDWNRGHNFGRVYFEADGDPALQLDVAVPAAGLASDAFAVDLTIWATLLEGFDRTIPAY